MQRETPEHLEYKGFIAKVENHPDDGVWSATVINAGSDLLVAEGLTLAALHTDFQEMIDEYQGNSQTDDEGPVSRFNIREG